MGRPTKRTKDNEKRILEVLKTGATRQMAYLSAGVGHSLFADWIKADEAFLQRVEEAEQAGRLHLFLRVTKASQPRQVTKVKKDFEKGVQVGETIETYEEAGDWRAALALLERLDRKHFGKNIDVTSNGQSLKAYAGFDLEEV